MNIILLSGGSGTRLWPLSNDVRSKQFLKIFKKEDGSKESMVQKMYRMIREVDSNANITIATSKNQIPQIELTLGNEIDVCIEPCRKDTYPAIALACSYLYKKGLNENEKIIVVPVDPDVDLDYFEKLKDLEKNCDDANITLMGIKPTYPSEKYGYILPNGKFTEKPTKEKAKELIDNGALWNGGVFAFKVSYIKEKTEEIIGTFDYDKIYSNYENLNKISFDYQIAEKENKIKVITFNGKWKDLGTWNSLTESMSDKSNGNVILSECNNTHIINELSIPLIALGINNAVVVATPDGILVSDKEQSSKLKNLVQNNRPMYEKRVWGEYRVLDSKYHTDGSNSITKELVIEQGKHISYQYHEHRTEMWTFTEGEGELIIDGKIIRVKRGDTITIKPLTKHAVKAINTLHIIEVQLGDKLVEEDIIRLDWDWE